MYPPNLRTVTFFCRLAARSVPFSASTCCMKYVNISRRKVDSGQKQKQRTGISSLVKQHSIRNRIFPIRIGSPIFFNSIWPKYIFSIGRLVKNEIRVDLSKCQSHEMCSTLWTSEQICHYLRLVYWRTFMRVVLGKLRRRLGSARRDISI